MGEQKLEIITPPNTLKSKVTVGGPGAVDLEALQRAEQIISSMADDYLKWAEGDLDKIGAAYQDLVRGKGERQAALDEVFRIAHDMKGQGGSFGYDLMTAIGNELCRAIEKMGRGAKPDLENEVVRIHIDSMKMVIAQRIRGDGGKQGAALMAGINKVCEKLARAAST
jgi:chemotaxis protein histidine kinase CheA